VLSSISLICNYFSYSDNIETYPTNFNSIVNSNITLNRIYFEFSIPRDALNTGDVRRDYMNDYKRMRQYESPNREVSIYDLSYYNNKSYHKNKFESYSPVKTVKKNNMAQILLTHKEGLCNFLIFANNCTPYVMKGHSLDEMKIDKFFGNFERVSAFGIDMSFLYESKNCLF
jgi:hypothetical protein